MIQEKRAFWVTPQLGRFSVDAPTCRPPASPPVFQPRKIATGRRLLTGASIHPGVSSHISTRASHLQRRGHVPGNVRRLHGEGDGVIPVSSSRAGFLLTTYLPTLHRYIQSHSRYRSKLATKFAAMAQTLRVTPLCTSLQLPPPRDAGCMLRDCFVSSAACALVSCAALSGLREGPLSHIHGTI